MMPGHGVPPMMHGMPPGMHGMPPGWVLTHTTQWATFSSLNDTQSHGAFAHSLQGLNVALNWSVAAGSALLLKHQTVRFDHSDSNSHLLVWSPYSMMHGMGGMMPPMMQRMPGMPPGKHCLYPSSPPLLQSLCTQWGGLALTGDTALWPSPLSSRTFLLYEACERADNFTRLA